MMSEGYRGRVWRGLDRNIIGNYILVAWMDTDPLLITSACSKTQCVSWHDLLLGAL